MPLVLSATDMISLHERAYVAPRLVDAVTSRMLSQPFLSELAARKNRIHELYIASCMVATQLSPAEERRKAESTRLRVAAAAAADASQDDARRMMSIVGEAVAAAIVCTQLADAHTCGAAERKLERLRDLDMEATRLNGVAASAASDAQLRATAASVAEGVRAQRRAKLVERANAKASREAEGRAVVTAAAAAAVCDVERASLVATARSALQREVCAANEELLRTRCMLRESKAAAEVRAAAELFAADTRHANEEVAMATAARARNAASFLVRGAVERMHDTKGADNEVREKRAHQVRCGNWSDVYVCSVAYGRLNIRRRVMLDCLLMTYRFHSHGSCIATSGASCSNHALIPLLDM